MKRLNSAMITNKLVSIILISLTVVIAGSTGMMSTTNTNTTVSSEGDATAVGRQGGGATPISSCGSITAPGKYVLTQNLTPTRTDLSGPWNSCIQIKADHVTLYGGGHMVDGSTAGDETGIVVEVVRNTTIKNVTVTGWGDHPWSAGIQVIRSYRVQLNDITAKNNSVGTKVSSSSNIIVRGGTFTGNQKGLLLYGDVVFPLESAIVTNNRIADNGQGIYMDGGNYYHVIQHNVIRDNGAGIVVEPSPEAAGADNVTVSFNVIANNTAGGIRNVDMPRSDANIGGIGHRTVIDGACNYWGTSDGPSSSSNATAPLADPETGALATGRGDSISEGLDDGVSNVHFDPFLTEPPTGVGPNEGKDT